MRMRGMTMTAALAALALAPAAARSQEPLALRTTTVAATDTTTTTDEVERARALLRAGEFRAARRVLAETVRERGEAGRPAARAWWLLAEIDHAAGRPLRAARQLDAAAHDAEVFGDPAMQARALLEAATLYAGERHFAQAATRVERLRPLLRSPHLPAEVRRSMALRGVR